MTEDINAELTPSINAELTPSINAELTPDDEITTENLFKPGVFDFKVEKHLSTLTRLDIEKQFVYHLVEHNEFFNVIKDFSSEYFHCTVYQDIYNFTKQQIAQGIETSVLIVKEYFLKEEGIIISEEDFENFQSGILAVSKKKMKGYALKLKELYYKRCIIELNVNNIKDVKYNEEKTLPDIISEIIEELKEIQIASAPIIEMDYSSGFEQLEQEIKNNEFEDRHSKGMPSGFKELDKLTGGIHNGELITIGAETGFGKTTFTTNMACNLLKSLNKSTDNKYKEVVLFYSMEMDARELQERILVTFSDLTLDKFNQKGTQKDRDIAIKTLQELKELNLIIKDKAGITVQDIEIDLLSAEKQNYIVKAVFIDYLQKMEIKNSNPNKKTEEVTKISNDLKQLALHKKIPIVTIAQFNRNYSNKDRTTPENTDFKNSSSIEQDSNIIILMYQKHKTKANTDNPDPYIIEDNKIIIKVSKNRHGDKGIVNMIFNREKLRFIEDGYDL